MSSLLPYHSGFYEALKSAVSAISQLPNVEFDQRWQRACQRVEEPWIRQTSAFNIDTWLLRCVCEEFSEYVLLSGDQIHELFFQFQQPPGFGSHLVGEVFDFRFPDGTTESVRIESVFLGPRFGMGYRIRSQSGRRMEFEKFD